MSSAGTSAIILAGGKSSRMGRPKAALPFGATTILERILAELRSRFDELIVVAAPAESEPFPVDNMIRNVPGAILVRDEEPWAGPADALVRGLEAATHEIAFVCSCDLPLLRAEVARALCEMIGGYDAAVPQVGARFQPLCAAYSRLTRDAVAAFASERRLTAIVARLNLRIVRESELRALDPDLRSFLNVNTPASYARAVDLAGL